MGKYIAEQTVKTMISNDKKIKGSNILILGVTFKEDCPDMRNTKVVDIIEELKTYGCNIDVYDPWVNKAEANKEYGITPLKDPVSGKYDVIVLAVAHDEFNALSIEQIKSFGKENHVLYDIKYLLKAHEVDGRV